MTKVQRTVYAWIPAFLLWIGITAPSAKADAIYQYTGNPFTLCGYGCPGNQQPENAPADWASDYIIATISFAAPLAPNLTFSDDVFSLLTAWSMKDALGYFSLSSAAGDLLNGSPADGLPPLVLSTDGSGNIVNYIMSASPVAGSVGPSVGILNPPFDCSEECGPGIFIADALAANTGNDDLEWDAFSSVPGQWTKVSAVPEPSPLLLMSLSGVILIIAKRWKHRTRPAPQTTL